MAKMQEFKCPCCGGSIEFDSSVQKMKCPFCDTEFDVGTLSEYGRCQYGSNGLPVLRKSGGNDRAAVRCTEAGLCDPV